MNASACRQSGAGVEERAGFFEEIVVAAGVGGDLAGVDVENFGGEFFDEVDVVADEDEGAVVAFEGHGQGLDGLDVEVGGGFVHQQEVGGIDEEFDEVEAALLAAAKHGGGFVDFFLSEHEGAEDAAGFVFVHGGGGGEDFFEDVFVGVE